MPLTPATGSVGIRIYELGMLPVDGSFSRFHGVLRFDPRNRLACQADVTVDVASLAMSSESVTATMLGPDFLDVPRFPLLSYRGDCDAAGMGGALTMHGVTRGLALSLDWQADRLAAAGRLPRALWGMTARPVLGGRTVRITVTVDLPRRATG